MHLKEFLHKMLSSVMHKKRLITLNVLVMTLLTNKRLSLSELGRAMPLPIKERSGIRRADRFLGNKRLNEEREVIHEVVTRKLVGSKARIDIIVDWSSIPNTTSLDYRKAAKEPWLLATSLDESRFLAKRVIKKYSRRMQIEEGFRDLKSSRYGFGFENAYSQKIKRIEVLLLIAMLASFIAWLTGWVAEKKGLHYQFQSNTTKNRRVLSLFFLGCQVIRRKIKIPINLLADAIVTGIHYAV